LPGRGRNGEKRHRLVKGRVLKGKSRGKATNFFFRRKEKKEKREMI